MKIVWLPVLLLAGCAAVPTTQVVKVPVPVQVPCPRPTIPPKPDLSSLAALQPMDSPQTIIITMTDALKKLAQDDQQLRALLGDGNAK